MLKVLFAFYFLGLYTDMQIADTVHKTYVDRHTWHIYST